jgi:hypothetical protein
VALLAAAVVVGIISWVIHGPLVNHWLAVHTGTNDVSGPWYGFWSGFGSDLAELGIVGAVGTGVYQLVKKYNCHEPGCWRVGTHPAADGKFLLCYRHHPDFQGQRPTHDLIVRLHAEQARQQAILQGKLDDIWAELAGRAGDGS